MNVLMLFQRRVRGIRVINLIGAALLLVLVVSLYLIKTFAGGERADILGAETQIADEQTRIRLLRAEVAYLEQPQRLERLAAPLNLAPTSGKRELAPGDLGQIGKDAQVAPTAEAPK